jgi:hypothetical protein
MSEAACAYREEHDRYTSTLVNPWSFWMRSVAWNQIYSKYMANKYPMEPGPWDDEEERVNGMFFVKKPVVPLQLIPCLMSSWSSSCSAGAVPPGPPPDPPPTEERASRWATSEPEQEDRKVRWQYKGGKKRKWMDYDDESIDKLEWAKENKKVSVVLVIDKWQYTVNLDTMTQFSWETDTERPVQRVVKGDGSRDPAI